MSPPTVAPTWAIRCGSLVDDDVSAKYAKGVDYVENVLPV
jgi:hypothetical protein